MVKYFQLSQKKTVTVSFFFYVFFLFLSIEKRDVLLKKKFIASLWYFKD